MRFWQNGQHVSLFISIIQMVTLIATTSILSRLLGPTEYGLYVLFASVAVLLSFVCEFGFPEVIIREIARLNAQNGSAASRDCLMRRVCSLASYLVVIAVALGGLWLVVSGNFAAVPGLFFLSLIPLIACNALVGALLIGQKRANLAHVLKLILPFWISVGLLVVAHQSGLRLTHAVAVGSLACGHVGGLIAMILFNVAIARREGEGAQGLMSVEPPTRRELLFLTLPFAGIAGLGVFNAQSDVALLSWLTGPSQTGIYQACLQIAACLPLIRRQLGSYGAARIAELIHLERHDDLVKYARPLGRNTAIVGIVCFLAVLIFGKQIIKTLYGSDFAEGYVPFLIITGAYAYSTLYGYCGIILAMGGWQNETLRISVVSVAMNLSFGIPGILYLGAIGAAGTLFIAVVYWNMATRYALHRRTGLDVSVWPKAVL